jgi:hypothetical protein
MFCSVVFALLDPAVRFPFQIIQCLCCLFAYQTTFVSKGYYEGLYCSGVKDGIPKEMVAEKAAREKAESGEAAFVPITLRASPVEIELPNGGVIRLPLGVGQVVLVEVIRAVGALRPWKAPKS